MKKINSIIVFIIISVTTWAQSPEKMTYQAVIRNSSNELVTGQQVGMQISILQGSADGSPVYTETQSPTTNTNGLVSIAIGDGTTSDDFSNINWSGNIYFIKTETDPEGGTNYTITGTSQLLSVPYALHAKTAETVSAGISETDPVFVADSFSIKTAIRTNTQAIQDTASNIRADIPDVSSFLSSETQTLADVAALNNSVNSQLKNVSTPTDDNDAATKAYVDILLEQIEYLELLAGVNDLIDIDSNIYKTIKIGTQVWMAENLKTTHYADGTPILEVTGNANWYTLTATDAAYCWYNDDSATYATTYGALYTWAVVNTNELCPTGWHVPTDVEWTTLTDYLGGTTVAGGKLKETGTTHWSSPNTGATNEIGFTALPGGYRNDNGAFYNFGDYGGWWSATEGNASIAWYRGMNYSNSNVARNLNYKEVGFSVRCVRD